MTIGLLAIAVGVASIMVAPGLRGLLGVGLGLSMLAIAVIDARQFVIPDVLVAIGLGLGAPSPGLMERTLRGANAEILPRPKLLSLAAIGLVLAVCTLGVMQWAQAPLGDTVARSMGVVTFALAGIFLALVINDEVGTVFSSKTLENGKLLQMCFFALIATIALTELGLFQRMFVTASLSVDQWVICAVVGAVPALVMEIVKFLGRRRAHA